MTTKIIGVNRQRIPVARHSGYSIFELKDGISTEESIEITPTKANMFFSAGDQLWGTLPWIQGKRLKELDRLGKRKDTHQIVSKEIEVKG